MEPPVCLPFLWMVPSPSFSNWNVILPKDTSNIYFFLCSLWLSDPGWCPLSSQCHFQSFHWPLLLQNIQLLRSPYHWTTYIGLHFHLQREHIYQCPDHSPIYQWLYSQSITHDVLTILHAQKNHSHTNSFLYSPLLFLLPTCLEHHQISLNSTLAIF